MDGCFHYFQPGFDVWIICFALLDGQQICSSFLHTILVFLFILYVKGNIFEGFIDFYQLLFYLLTNGEDFFLFLFNLLQLFYFSLFEFLFGDWTTPQSNKRQHILLIELPSSLCTYLLDIVEHTLAYIEILLGLLYLPLFEFNLAPLSYLLRFLI